MDQHTKDQINSSLKLGVTMLKLMSEMPEMMKETAKIAMMYKKAFLKEGFTEEESVILVSGVLSK